MKAAPHVEVARATGATIARFDGGFVVHVDDALVQVVGSDAARWLADARATIDRMALPPEPPKAPSCSRSFCSVARCK
jgi:hypothetical protein